jgi:hypothetical protein
MPADGLTPTEQHLIEHLREGLHDAEIGVRLGLPVGDIKVRINQLLQREHLLDRAALLAWYESAPAEEAPPLRPNDGRRAWWPAAVAGAFVGAGLTALVGFAIWPDDTSAPAGASVDVDQIQTAIAEGRFGEIQLGQGGLVVIDGLATPMPERPTPEVLIAPTPAYRIAGQVPSDLAMQRLRKFGGTETLAYYGPGWSTTSGGESGYLVANESLPAIDAVSSADGARIAVLHQQTGPGTAALTLRIFNSDIELLRRFSLEGGTDLLFFAGDDLVVQRPGDDQGWHTFSLTEGTSLPLTQPPDSYLPAGWLPGAGVVWLGDNGRFLDAGGNLLFLVELEGVMPETIDAFVFNPFANLDTGRTDDETGEFSSFDDVKDGVVMVAWRNGGHRLVSVVSLATGQSLLAYEADFTPVAGVRGGFAGTYCLVNFDCKAARMDLDGALTMFALSGPILAARSGPFARVKDGAACAVLLAEPGPAPVDTPCVPPGRLLRLFLASDDQRTWTVQVRHRDGIAYLRVIDERGGTAWVPAGSVDYAAEHLLGGR